jgi:hypothetical protein
MMHNSKEKSFLFCPCEKKNPTRDGQDNDFIQLAKYPEDYG